VFKYLFLGTLNYNKIGFIFLFYSLDPATKIAKSLVINPFSTVSITDASKALQNLSRSLFPSKFAL